MVDRLCTDLSHYRLPDGEHRALHNDELAALDRRHGRRVAAVIGLVVLVLLLWASAAARILGGL